MHDLQEITEAIFLDVKFSVTDLGHILLNQKIEGLTQLFCFDFKNGIEDMCKSVVILYSSVLSIWLPSFAYVFRIKSANGVISLVKIAEISSRKWETEKSIFVRRLYSALLFYSFSAEFFALDSLFSFCEKFPVIKNSRSPEVEHEFSSPCRKKFEQKKTSEKLKFVTTWLICRSFLH